MKLKCLIFDAPAKSYILAIKGHTAYFGCTKCVEEGNFVNNRMMYQNLNAQLRTNESFRNKTQEEYHRIETSLKILPLDLVS